MRVHQLTATLAYGDAVSNDVLEIDKRLKKWGLASAVYAENIEPRLAGVCQRDAAFERYLDQDEDLLIYHYSVYTANLDLYRRSRNRKIRLWVQAVN